MDEKELNKELKEEINRMFSDLAREIGNNRQQLANKVLSQNREINKELSRSAVTDERKKELLAEVNRIVKMAHQQLPHLRMNLNKPGPAAGVTPAPRPAPPPKPAVPAPPKEKPVVKAAPAATPKPKKESKPVKSKPVKKAAPAKKTTTAKKKKK